MSDPRPRQNWSADADLLQAMPECNPCMEGWESRSLFNYDYQIITLSEAEFNFLKACNVNASPARTVQGILLSAPLSLAEIRKLLELQLILLILGSS